MRVQGIVLQEQAPSVIPSQQLYRWTKYRTGGYYGDNYRYGAVKPPDSRYQWFPAAIGKETILIADTKSFPTPEKAVGWLQTAGHANRPAKRSTRAPRERGNRQ